MEALNGGDVLFAAKKFNEAEILFPQADSAPQSALMAAYSYYTQDYYGDAIAELKRFLKVYPSYKDLGYVYYLLGICYYEQIVDVERDADMTYRALDAFEELLRRYPESQYARDSKLKADLARSQLAGKEMAVGRFYLKEGHINAAIKRFATVVKEYDQTNQVPEALYRMVESYLSLGLTDEADRVAQVANYNFPDSYWTEQVNLVVENPGRAGPRGLIGSIADRALSLF